MTTKTKQPTLADVRTKYVSFASAAQVLGVSERAIRYAVDSGKLAAVNCAPPCGFRMRRIERAVIGRLKRNPPAWLRKSRRIQALKQAAKG